MFYCEIMHSNEVREKGEKTQLDAFWRRWNCQHVLLFPSCMPIKMLTWSKTKGESHHVEGEKMGDDDVLAPVGLKLSSAATGNCRCKQYSMT